jgi:hypothetical protein
MLFNKSLRKEATPAQIARWRGWSEVFFGDAYGKMLQHTENFMNNMMGERGINEIWRPLLRNPNSMGAERGVALTEENIKLISKCWYPVHAMGYNFLKSNGESARTLAQRIHGLVAGYKRRGF